MKRQDTVDGAPDTERVDQEYNDGMEDAWFLRACAPEFRDLAGPNAQNVYDGLPYPFKAAAYNPSNKPNYDGFEQ